MLGRGSGAIFFTGASASVKGYANSAPFAMGKFALRGLAQSMARELAPKGIHRSEEHTSELQSLRHLVCRLLLEKKNNNTIINRTRLNLKRSPCSSRFRQH